MILHVDQSIKWEVTKADTVLALASTGRDTIEATVVVPATVKRACLEVLRRRGHRGTSTVLRLFSATLFLLLEPYAAMADRIVIDSEYPGHEQDIQGALLNHLRRKHPRYDAARLAFGHVRKSSSAHRLALRTMRGQKKPGRVLRADDLLALLGKKEKDRGERH